MSIGITRYSTNFTGIGGKIKQQPEDFQVEEISDSGLNVRDLHTTEQYGLYYHILIHRINRSHDFTIRQLQHFFRVNEDAISFAGIKDKYAEIYQEAAIFQPKIQIKQITTLADGLNISPLGFSRSGMQKGHISGNKFTILIRDTKQLESSEFQKLQRSFLQEGILNYYGPQRFGGNTANTATFGKALLEGNYEKAVNIYLEGDSGFRSLWKNTHDPAKVLTTADYIPAIERKVLQSLQQYNNYKKATTAFPDYLLNIAQRAFISLLWNQYLSIRGMDLTNYKGERIKANNVEIALPSNKWAKPLNNYWEEVFAQHNITMKLFTKIRHTARMLLLFPQEFKIEQQRNSTITSFVLPTGAYATIVLREIMRH